MSLVLRSPELDTALQICLARVEGQDHLPQLVGNAIPDAPQDTTVHLGHKDTLLAHGQNSQVLLLRTASQQVSPQPVQVPRATHFQVQDPAFAFVEFQTVLLCPSLQPVNFLLKGCTALWGIDHFSHLCVISELSKEASTPSSKSLINNTGPSIKSWGTPLVTGLALDPMPLISTLWNLLTDPPHCPLIQSILTEFTYEDVVRDSVKSLAEVKVDSIHCSPLIHPSSFFIIEGNQVGQASFTFSESMLTTSRDC
ncbi:hypothetical protein BTVI_101645 [Pitangus sulphuratus]|nr:hypothetical protein BTVI_101645 [Pitangus sulphuratus]